MKKHYALVEGNNFFIDLDGEKTRIGFYATFYFESRYQSKSDILKYISTQLEIRIKHSDVVFLASPFSFFYVKELRDIENESGDEGLAKGGFSFFKMSKFREIVSISVYYIKYALFKLRLLDNLKRPVLLEKVKVEAR